MVACDIEKPGRSGAIFSVLALVAAQLFSSSWHVIGKHVMHQVPYLVPISYVLIRTLISSLVLLLVGVIHEGYVPFPPLFLDGLTARSELSSQGGLLTPSSSSPSIQNGNSIGLSLSQANSEESLNLLGVYENVNVKMAEGIMTAPLLPPHRRKYHHRRPRSSRRKKSQDPKFKDNVGMVLCSVIHSRTALLRNIKFMSRYYQQRIDNLNPEVFQIINAGLSGMFFVPMCYTSGLILTSPVVVSVWDGPMVPLGCFTLAIALGLERMSKSHPFGQVGSLLLTVGGSMVVLLVDYLGGSNGNRGESNIARENAIDEHVQFIQGNMLLMGLVVAYSATALLQKRLVHYPPIQLTSWMFRIGFFGCLFLLTLDSIMGSRITGSTLGSTLLQIHLALTTSPTFLCGLLYAAVFVAGACFSIYSYASSHLESSVIYLFLAMQPPITAVLEWIWEGKELGWQKLGGMVCVGLGICIFTFIKIIDKHRMNDGKHEHQNKHSHSQEAQAFRAESIQISYDIHGEGSLNRDRGSPHVKNRISHAEV